MRPIWIQDLKDAGGKLEIDGTVLVYHGTTAKAAEQIYKEKVLKRPVNTPDMYGVYVAAGKKAKEFVSHSYGDFVVPMKIAASDLEIEDFAMGRWVTFRIVTKRGTYRPIWIGAPIVVENDISFKQWIILKQSQ
jgi:hypothetical protein